MLNSNRDVRDDHDGHDPQPIPRQKKNQNSYTFVCFVCATNGHNLLSDSSYLLPDGFPHLQFKCEKVNFLR